MKEGRSETLMELAWMLSVVVIGAIIYFVGYNNGKDKVKNKETKNQEEKIETKLIVPEYLYKDLDGIVHIKLDCSRMYKTGSTKQGVRRIRVEWATSRAIEYCCRKCVNDESYDSIKAIVEENDDL